MLVKKENKKLALPQLLVSYEEKGKLYQEKSLQNKQYTCNWNKKVVLIGKHYEKIINNFSYECKKKLCIFLVYGTGGTGKTRILEECKGKLINNHYNIINFIGFDNGASWKDIVVEIAFQVFGLEKNLASYISIEMDDIVLSDSAEPLKTKIIKFLRLLKREQALDNLEDYYEVIFSEMSRNKYAIIIDNLQSYSSEILLILKKMIQFLGTHTKRKNSFALLMSLNTALVYENEYLDFIVSIQRMACSDDAAGIFCENITGFTKEEQAIAYLQTLLCLDEYPLNYRYLKETLAKSSLKPKYIELVAGRLFQEECVQLKNNKGITMVALVVTIIVILILAGISIGQGDKAIKISQLENLRTNMLLIQTKSKEYLENANFNLGTNIDNVTEEEKTNRVNKAKENLKGTEITDGNIFDGNINITTEQITQDNTNYIYYYKLTTEDLEKMGLKNVESNDKKGWYIVKYDIKNDEAEIYNQKGFEKENKTYYYSYDNGNGYTKPAEYTTKSTNNFSFAFVGDPQIGSSNELKGKDTKEFYDAQSNAVKSDAFNWSSTLNAALEKTDDQLSFVVSAGDQIQTTKKKLPNKDASKSEIEYTGYLSPEALKSTYTNYEILIVENNSKNSKTFKYYDIIQKNPKIKVIKYTEKGFNYSKINNFAVIQAKGKYIVLLNF